MASTLHPVDDRSHIGGIRRAGTELAQALGFDVDDTGKVALAITEAGTNIIKHAGRGQIVLRGLARGSVGGLEILALDRGPGIADIGASLRDGQSTAGGTGTGLGALSRVAHEFDLYSQPQRGTAMRLMFWAKPSSQVTGLEVGAVSVPKVDETVSGDEWAMESDGHRATVMVADGLGHGPDAARAARTATQVLAQDPLAPPEALIGACHAALAPTRGAAVAVVRLDPGSGTGTIAGVGNIAGRVHVGTTTRNLVSHNGTVGHNIRRIQEFTFPFPSDALLVLHSDGLTTHWSLADYPGLAAKHVGLIAGVLYRDHNRGTDDVTVVVVRSKEPQTGRT
jgi:anti-sigma regulatory factor (Ser/Thr protein kinase)